jgi:hypothetical protein
MKRCNGSRVRYEREGGASIKNSPIQLKEKLRVRKGGGNSLLPSLAISLAERVLKITPENVISAVTRSGRDAQEHAVLAPIAGHDMT